MRVQGLQAGSPPIPSSLLPSRSALLWRGEHDLTPEEFPLWETLEKALVPCDHLLEQSLPPSRLPDGAGAPRGVRGVTTSLGAAARPGICALLRKV